MKKLFSCTLKADNKNRKLVLIRECAFLVAVCVDHKMPNLSPMQIEQITCWDGEPEKHRIEKFSAF